MPHLLTSINPAHRSAPPDLGLKMHTRQARRAMHPSASRVNRPVHAEQCISLVLARMTHRTLRHAPLDYALPYVRTVPEVR